MDRFFNFFNFDNIGGKIKNFAKWSCWVTILLIWVSMPILFITLLSDDVTAIYVFIPLIGGVVASILVWVGSWTMYAFGEFVEDMHAIRYKSDYSQQSHEHIAPYNPQQTAVEEKRNQQEDKPVNKCQLCDSYSEHLTYCVIKDTYTTRYRTLCDDCMKKYNATPTKKEKPTTPQ